MLLGLISETIFNLNKEQHYSVFLLINLLRYNCIILNIVLYDTGVSTMFVCFAAPSLFQTSLE